MRLIHRASFAFSALLFLTIIVAAQSGKFTVQIVAASSQAEAETTVKELKAKGVEAYILKSQLPGKGTFYRVRAGAFTNPRRAQIWRNAETARPRAGIFDCAVRASGNSTYAGNSARTSQRKPSFVHKTNAKYNGEDGCDRHCSIHEGAGQNFSSS